MKPNSRLRAVAAALGGAALAAMGALAIVTGVAMGVPGPTADVATINAPEAPEMTLGQTITATTTTSILSFRPAVTAAPAASATPGD